MKALFFCGLVLCTLGSVHAQTLVAGSTNPARLTPSNRAVYPSPYVLRTPAEVYVTRGGNTTYATGRANRLPAGPGLVEKSSVPYPTAYAAVPIVRSGNRVPVTYAIVPTEFGRYESGTFVGAQTVGTVQTVVSSKNTGGVLTLSTNNGLRLQARTGSSIAFGKGRYHCMGWHKNNYVLRCHDTGRYFFFRR